MDRQHLSANLLRDDGFENVNPAQSSMHGSRGENYEDDCLLEYRGL
jgi:hypothetical protein